SFGFLKGGARAYLAVSGGIDVPVVLGSRSTYILGALGGHQGRTLKAGDELPLGEGSGKAGLSLPANLRRAGN
ncbi:MAG: allophanate hydrolase, partial [Mesorhizobium sp.]